MALVVLRWRRARTKDGNGEAVAGLRGFLPRPNPQPLSANRISHTGSSLRLLIKLCENLIDFVELESCFSRVFCGLVRL